MTTNATTLKARIDGDTIDLGDVRDTGWTGLLMAEEGRMEWYIAEDSESAGAAAAEYWRDMAEDDAKEFVCIIGEERLVQWALGRSDSYGIRSLEDFLELTAKHPEGQWASYDGNEIDIEYDAEDYMDEAREQLEAREGGEPFTDEDVKALAETMLQEAKDDFQSEHGFIPTVAYRHN